MFYRLRQGLVRLIAGSKGVKGWYELHYWKKAKARERGTFSNAHYCLAFTAGFEVSKSFYDNKKICDIGCGPRGSLEWADNALERVGIDPLADEYLKLNEGKHSMRYVKSNAECIPFSDEYFDIALSLNSLDHVDNVKEALKEISRILKIGGYFLLATDIHSKPSVAEPQAFNWALRDSLFSANFKIIKEYQLEKYEKNHIKPILEKRLYDHSDHSIRCGIYLAICQKNANALNSANGT